MKVVAAIVVYNEGNKLRQVLIEMIMALNGEVEPWAVIIVDDGSTDGCVENAKDLTHILGAKIIRHEKNLGVGAAIRTAIFFAREQNYDVITIIAGNGKMDPREMPRLLQPIKAADCDYVQGSRYIAGGNPVNVPMGRQLAIKAFTFFINSITRFNGTDVTCGYRAYRLRIFDDQRINLNNTQLDRYELEFYIHYKVLTGSYKIEEVPVSMRYPTQGKNYSKIKAGSGWWSMVRPWIYFSLRIWQ